jgi:hypothetical protein
MVRACRELLECLYIIRADEHDDESLAELEKHEQLYVEFREIFRETGVRADFNLPRQHALFHWRPRIQDFGSMNGTCTTLVESKHRTAIKEPWRRSSKYEPMHQMLITNSRMTQLRACATAFRKHGLLRETLMTSVLRATGALELMLDPADANEALPYAPLPADEEGEDEDEEAQMLEAAAAAAEPEGQTEGDDEEGVVDGPRVTNSVQLSNRRGATFNACGPLSVMLIHAHSTSLSAPS